MKRIFALVLGLVSLTLNAQTSDLGLIYGANDLYRFNLEFRKPLNEKYKLKLGYFQGGHSGLYWGMNGDLATVSDSLVVERMKMESQLQFSLTGGIERRLKESMFSIGVDLLISYLQTKDGFYNEVRELQDNGNWITIRPLEPLNSVQAAPSLRKTNFINPGLQFKLAMDIPIENSFFLHLFVGQIVSAPIYLNEKIEQDPFNEFQTQKNSFQIKTTSQVGIGLRYRFKG